MPPEDLGGEAGSIAQAANTIITAAEAKERNGKSLLPLEVMVNEPRQPRAETRDVEAGVSTLLHH